MYVLVFDVIIKSNVEETQVGEVQQLFHTIREIESMHATATES